MALVLWTHNFMECQGWPVSDNVVYQDNQGTMRWLLEQNHVQWEKDLSHSHI